MESRKNITGVLLSRWWSEGLWKVKKMETIKNLKKGNALDKIIRKTADNVPKLVKKDLRKIILFGSYARGDYSEESDVDIAVLVGCERSDLSKYMTDLVALSAEMDFENNMVVNFVCLPYDEFNEKKSYYPFYNNIEKEGKEIYG